jgi:hypothetical protein
MKLHLHAPALAYQLREKLEKHLISTMIYSCSYTFFMQNGHIIGVIFEQVMKSAEAHQFSHNYLADN